MMRIAIATDAWKPQKNGVVVTLTNLRRELRALGHTTRFIIPDRFSPRIPFPLYPEIPISLMPYEKTKFFLETFSPDAIHIVTEGTIGLATRRYCVKHKKAFTTSYHTMFPEYLEHTYGLSAEILYKGMRWFHRKAACTMVSSEHMCEALLAKKFKHLKIWPRGVDTHSFTPQDRNFLTDPRPIYMYAGQISEEKNIEAFLNARPRLSGTKYVVGDGPQLAELKGRYPHVKFVGHIPHGVQLSKYYSAADVFVFPSMTDTLGLVMIEAQACGTPVAAYPINGPRVVVRSGINGFLNHDLTRAMDDCLALDRDAVRASTLDYTWEASTQAFIRNLVHI